MTHPMFQQPAPPKRGPGVVIGIVLVALAFLCVAGTILFGVTSVTGAPTKSSSHPIVSVPSATASPVIDAQLTLTRKLELTVKITSKKCFGTAGCNVEFTTTAAVPDGADLSADCDVTYQVTGLDDDYVNTMTVHADRTYDHDAVEFGSTSKSSAKLKAAVTSVTCNG